jgi:hypothetical protein
LPRQTIQELLVKGVLPGSRWIGVAQAGEPERVPVTVGRILCHVRQASRLHSVSDLAPAGELIVWVVVPDARLKQPATGRLPDSPLSKDLVCGGEHLG